MKKTGFIQILLIILLLTLLTLSLPAIPTTNAETTPQYKLEQLWVTPDQGADVEGLDWSPEGKYIVIGTKNGWLKVYDADTGKYLWGLELGGRVIAVDWNPDGRYIAATNWDGYAVFVIDASTHSIVWSKKLDSDTYGVAWDPSGNYLAVGTISYLYLFTKTGEQQWRTEYYGSSSYVGHIAWSHKGDKIAFDGGENGYSIVVYSRDGRKLWEYKTGGAVHSPDWSPDDQYLAAGSCDNHVYVFDKNGNLLWSRNMEDKVKNVAWDPTGEYLAVSGWFGTALFTKTGKQIWINKNMETWWSEYVHGNLEWSKQGILAVGGTKLYILDKNGDILAESENLGGYTRRVAWSPTDQTRIATVGDYNKLYVWSFLFFGSTTTVTKTVTSTYTLTSTVTRSYTYTRWETKTSTVTSTLSYSVSCPFTVTSTVTETITTPSITTFTKTITVNSGVSREALMFSIAILVAGFIVFMYGWRKSKR